MEAIVNDEVMRFVVPSGVKARFKEKCARSGQGMSERMRQLVMQDVADVPSASVRLDAILGSARKKGDASDLPVPSIEDIDRYIESIRDERIGDSLLS